MKVGGVYGNRSHDALAANCDKALSVAAVRVKCRVPTAGFVVLNEILGSDDCAGLNGAERRLISHPC